MRRVIYTVRNQHGETFNTVSYPQAITTGNKIIETRLEDISNGVSAKTYYHKHFPQYAKKGD